MKIENYEEKQFLELNYTGSNDYYVSFELLGQDKYFHGKDSICIYKESLKNFIDGLQNLKNKGENVILNDYDSDAFIKVIMYDNLGHYKIYYQIGGTHTNRFSRMTLETDNIGILNFTELGKYTEI